MVRATSSSSSAPSQPEKAKGSRKPPSARQLIANRLNARKSTGPRTPEGRARARMNALRHGLCARVVLLPGEDWREYQAFADGIVDDLKPVGVVQEMLAGRVAALAWALQRLPIAVGDVVDRDEQGRFDRWFEGRGLHVSLKHEVQAELQAYDAYRGRLRAWQEQGEQGPKPEPPPPAPAAWERADRVILDAIVHGDPPPDERDPAGVVADALGGAPAFAGVLRLEDHERRLWAAMLSALRALERRQRAARNAERSAADARDDGDVNHAKDANDAAPETEVAPVPEVDPVTPAPRPCEPPARNEANSAEEQAPAPDAPPASQVPAGKQDKTSHPSPEVAHDVPAPGALPDTPVVLAPPGRTAPPRDVIPVVQAPPAFAPGAPIRDRIDDP